MSGRTITEITTDLESLHASVVTARQILKDAANSRQALLRELCAATATRQRRAKQDELPFEEPEAVQADDSKRKELAVQFANVEPTDPPSPEPVKPANPWRKK